MRPVYSPRYAACLCAIGVLCAASAPANAQTIVRFDTVMGSFDIQLFDNVMPVTVQNFLGYVSADRYAGSVVHRNSDTADPILRDFVIQGGGFYLHDPTPPGQVIGATAVTTDPPINDEPGGGVTGPSNTRGTIAMAKSGPNTVTSQWFINQGDNSFLDNPLRPDGGFSAFGKVLGDGMTVVDAIGDLPIPADFGFFINAPFNDLPLRNFSGTSITDIRVQHTVVVNSVSVVTPLPGDFNLDGVVDADDHRLLELGYGLTTGALYDDGDADFDGDVDGADVRIWQLAFSAAATAGVAAVPEPAFLTLISSLTIAAACQGRRR